MKEEDALVRLEGTLVRVAAVERRRNLGGVEGCRKCRNDATNLKEENKRNGFNISVGGPTATPLLQSLN